MIEPGQFIVMYVFDGDSLIFPGQSSTSVGFQSMMAEGAVNCIGLHKQGLFVAGDDGVLRHLEVSANTVKMIDSYQIGVSITSLSFNSSHYKLALGSPKVSMNGVSQKQQQGGFYLGKIMYPWCH